ncbi:helix-turn-helix domain-containing protein [Rickettsia endosymbiont of Oedothorax gibbosus]|uniref:helix-turn-helix domain-containing protein n=1 Tax=Rickettsia endosymbiont of Oedothorax gibbosus TaxID=931099 RepID=UPI00202441DF|nr:helix-turn-helix transcriptional regulator [Rickettsia endosymbiont of Oedothorax gibbosus]
MAIVHLIQKFLKRKLLENRLTKREFSRQSGVPYNTLFQILHALRSNTNLATIIKIANYFSCSIDEVVGRKKYISKNNYNNNDIILSNYNFKLRNFIVYKIKEQNLNPYQLSKYLGFSETVIWQFINDDKITRTLNSSVILALADYFQVSIDEMIGRVKPTTTVNSSDENSDKDIDLNNL